MRPFTVAAASPRTLVRARVQLGMLERHGTRFEPGTGQKAEPVLAREQSFYVAIGLDADRPVGRPQQIRVVDEVGLGFYGSMSLRDGSLADAKNSTAFRY